MKALTASTFNSKSNPLNHPATKHSHLQWLKLSLLFFLSVSGYVLLQQLGAYFVTPRRDQAYSTTLWHDDTAKSSDLTPQSPWFLSLALNRLLCDAAVLGATSRATHASSINLIMASVLCHSDTSAAADSPENTWSAITSVSFQSINECEQGGYILGSGNRGVVLKVDDYGYSEWSKQAMGACASSNIFATTDGGYLSRRSGSGGTTNAGSPTVITKFGANMEVIWSKQILGQYGHNYGYGMLGDSSIEINDGGSYVVSGRNQHYFFSGYPYDQDVNLWLAKFSEEGNIIWIKTYGFPGHHHLFNLHKLLEDSSGNYVLAGVEADSWFGVNYYDLIAKFNSDGSLVWAKNLHAYPDGGSIYSVVEGHNGGYVTVGGNAVYNGEDKPRYCVVNSLDSNGNVLWTKEIAGSKQNIICESMALSNEGYVISGGSRDTDNYIIIKLAVNGDLLWSKGVHAPGDNTPSPIIINSKKYGGSVLNEDGLIMKLDSDGNGRDIAPYTIQDITPEITVSDLFGYAANTPLPLSSSVTYEVTDVTANCVVEDYDLEYTVNSTYSPPTKQPTENPSGRPTGRPSQPSQRPTGQPSSPSGRPSSEPTHPTGLPSLAPTLVSQANSHDDRIIASMSNALFLSVVLVGGVAAVALVAIVCVCYYKNATKKESLPQVAPVTPVRDSGIDYNKVDHNDIQTLSVYGTDQPFYIPAKQSDQGLELTVPGTQL